MCRKVLNSLLSKCCVIVNTVPSQWQLNFVANGLHRFLYFEVQVPSLSHTVVSVPNMSVQKSSAAFEFQYFSFFIEKFQLSSAVVNVMNWLAAVIFTRRGRRRSYIMRQLLGRCNRGMNVGHVFDSGQSTVDLFTDFRSFKLMSL